MEQTQEAARRKGGKRLQQPEPKQHKEKPAKAPKTGGSKAWVIPAVVAVAAAGYVGLCAYAGGQSTFYPNYQVNGIDVGGLTVAQAQERLNDDFPARTITLRDAEDGSELTTVTYEQLGLDADALGNVVADRMKDQQQRSFFSRGAAYLSGLMGRKADGGVLPTPNEATLQETVTGLADALQRPAVDGSWSMEGEKLSIVKGQDGRTVNADALQGALMNAYYSRGDEVPVTFAGVAATGVNAQAIHDQIAGEMRNAGYDPATKTIIPEQVGADFDVAALQAKLDAAAPGETITTDADIQYPNVTAQQLKGVLFRDVLGECRTHVGGTAARISNVKLAASSFNGVVLNTGETFSYNGTVGQRTAAKGYKPAPAYVKGETVDEIGGGVCQPSSTLYLACLRANLEITERYAHRYAPSYIDWGMDATVSWNGPDYKFTNNTDYPVKIVTSYNGGYLTVQLVGTKTDGLTYKMTNKVLSTTPWETVYEDDPTLAPGTEKVKVTPYTGYKVVTFHHIYDANGKEISSHQEATSDYKVRNKVIQRGPVTAAGEAEVPVAPNIPPVIGGGDAPILPPDAETLPVNPPAPETPAPETPVTPAPEPTVPTESGGTIVVDLFPENP